MQLKSQPPTARQACQHAALEKPSASVREACYKARLLFLHCSSRMGGEHPQCSPLRTGKALPEMFCFPARTKTWFVLASEWRKKEKKKSTRIKRKKKKEGSKRFTSSFAFYIKKKSTAKPAKFPLPLLNSVEKISKNLKISAGKLEKASSPRNPYEAFPRGSF